MRNSVPTGNPWGDIVGYSRAVRVGSLVFVSGTTASGPEGSALHPDDPAGQARIIFERMDAALNKLGAALKHVVETRIYLRDIAQWEAVGRVHGEVCGTSAPVTTMVEVSGLISRDLLVESSATAVVEEPAGSPTA